jgi:hypothetical protein
MRNDLIKYSEKYNVLRFGSEELVRVEEPYNLNEVPEEDLVYIPEVMKRESFIAATIEQPFVCEVSNAELLVLRLLDLMKMVTSFMKPVCYPSKT